MPSHDHAPAPPPPGAASLEAAADLFRQGEWEAALDRCRHVLSADVGHGAAGELQVRACLALRRPAEALALADARLRAFPADAKMHSLRGDALEGLGHVREAMEAYTESLRLDPSQAEVCNAMAFVHQSLWGDLPAAHALYRRAVALEPDNLDYHSNLLLFLHFLPLPPERIFAEHLEWARRHGQVPEKYVHPFRSPAGRRLRVGYVSSDFKSHVVACFLESVLRHHDRGRVEVFCYADVDRPDATTRRFQGMVEHWRSIYGRSNAEAARQVVEDRVDVLVDLTGHSGLRRLKMFARKPAPVQATWLGYPDTTGLPEMDWRIVDAITDPPGLTERWHVERLCRLPGCFLCYAPPADAPPVVPRPADAPIVFGSFNNWAKAESEWIVLASRVLHSVPGSRLAIKSFAFRGEAADVRERIQARFAAQGISPERLDIRPRDETWAVHLARYGDVDIMLDTFPYHGTTTTCEALWMGVPVVSLAGETHVSRVGASLLAAAGLSECVAATPEEFVRIAAGLAADPARRMELRRSLRSRMAPLTDGAAFAAKIEEAYHRMAWREA